MEYKLYYSTIQNHRYNWKTQHYRHNVQVGEETQQDLVTRTNKSLHHFLPEGSLKDLACGDLLGTVVIAVEDVSKRGLIGWGASCLATVHSLGAGLRQRQTCATIRPTLIILNAAAGVALVFICQCQDIKRNTNSNKRINTYCMLIIITKVKKNTWR